MDEFILHDDELESPMTDYLMYTCQEGPLRELKKKINSSNINSRTSASLFEV